MNKYILNELVIDNGNQMFYNIRASNNNKMLAVASQIERVTSKTTSGWVCSLILSRSGKCHRPQAQPKVVFLFKGYHNAHHSNSKQHGPNRRTNKRRGYGPLSINQGEL